MILASEESGGIFSLRPSSSCFFVLISSQGEKGHGKMFYAVSDVAMWRSSTGVSKFKNNNVISQYWYSNVPREAIL